MVTTEWKQLHWLSLDFIARSGVSPGNYGKYVHLTNNHEKASMLTTTQYEKSANVEILFNSTYLRDSAIKLW